LTQRAPPIALPVPAAVEARRGKSSRYPVLADLMVKYARDSFSDERITRKEPAL
jgi:hypothetical protein